MNSPWKMSILAGLLLLLFALPAVAQITKSMSFETTFPFYAGNAKMPAGAYRVTQPNMSENLLLIESTNGSHSVFVEFSPTTAENPHPQSDVTFNKYDKADFLNMIWVQGQNTGMQLIPEKVEQSAAKAGAPVRHTVAAKGSS